MSPKKPGKPSASLGSLKSINVIWSPPEKLLPSARYMVQYKEINPDSKWIRHQTETEECFLNIKNLKSGAKFVFRVRMMNDEEEWEYSDPSDEIYLQASAAFKWIESMGTTAKTSEVPMKTVPMTEDVGARNADAKSRRMIIGQEVLNSNAEKTIMIMGSTGAGKSTLVDALMNYIYGISWHDSFRITVENLEHEEKINRGNQTCSQTRWITSYVIHPVNGTRLDYTITIIDTPGYDDVEGDWRDKEITEQIRKLFSIDGKKGIQYLDAICFVVKSSDVRMTQTQKYIFKSILSIFQKDIIENFCMMITFATDKSPPVIAALKEEHLPHEEYFLFNNSALYSKNTGPDSRRASIDWETSEEQFSKFFDALNKLQRKSLIQSKEVLAERRKLEITSENVRKKLQAAIQFYKNSQYCIMKLNTMKSPIDQSKDDSEWEVPEGSKQRTYTGVTCMNCHNCKNTCHRNCCYAYFHRLCDVMTNGHCSQCAGKCSASSHEREKFEYQYVIKNVKKSFSKIVKELIDKTHGAVEASLENIVRDKEKILESLKQEIILMCHSIVKSKNKLKKIALREDPLSTKQYFDDMISEEKRNVTEGYQERIEMLSNFKRDVEDLEKFEETGKSGEFTIFENMFKHN